jgi:hypothetical protein
MKIASQKSSLRSQITIFKWIGGISAIVALIPLIWAGIQVLANHSFFKENELGDFIGGTSGTFASFAGLAFVYVGFLGQQLQILMQQEELEMNRQELKDTRAEIKGQKKQLELQNKHFEIQAFNDIFFKLYGIFKNQSEMNLYSDLGDEPLIKKLEVFITLLKNDNILFQHGKLSPNDQIELINKNFEKAFKGGFARVRGMISNSLAILLHIERNKKIIDEEYYLSIIQSGLTIHEERIIFYSFWSDEVYVSDEQEVLLRRFSAQFPSRNLLNPLHKRLV